MDMCFAVLGESGSLRGHRMREMPLRCFCRPEKKLRFGSKLAMEPIRSATRTESAPVRNSIPQREAGVARSHSHGVKRFDRRERKFGRRGDPSRTRTPNLLIRSQLLYPVELRGLCSRHEYSFPRRCARRLLRSPFQQRANRSGSPLTLETWPRDKPPYVTGVSFRNCTRATEIPVAISR